MSDADRIAALEAAVHDLLVEVKRLRAHRGSMARTHRCPVCGSGSLIHFKRIREKIHGASIDDLTLQKIPKFWGTDSFAPTSAYACRSCGLVEWHAMELEEVQPADDVELIEAPAELEPESGGPFR